MRFTLTIILSEMSRVNFIYRLLNYVTSLADCSGSRNGTMYSGYSKQAFDVSLRICVGILLFISLSVSLPVRGASVVIGTTDQPGTLPNCDTVQVFTERILFPKASSVILRGFSGNASAIDSIRRFLSVNDSRNLIDIKVIGSHSPEGKISFNKKLAEARARSLGDLIREIAPGINPELSIIHPAAGQTGDYRSLRKAELQVSYRDIISEARNKALREPICRQENTKQEKAGDNASADTTFSIIPYGSGHCTQDSCVSISHLQDLPSERDGWNLCGRLFATTNMLYDALLTPNIGVGMSIGDRVTLLVDWMYARWSNHDRRLYWRIYGGDVEARCRIGARVKGSPLGGHHIGVYGSMACYDFQGGRSHIGVLSDIWNYAAGISYTYSLPVSTHFNIDFNLGVGYLWGRYKKHIPIDDCDVWLSTHKMSWFGPTRAGVTLVWLIGNQVKNSKKGGSR